MESLRHSGRDQNLGSTARAARAGFRVVAESARGLTVLALTLQIIAGLLAGAQLLLAREVINDLTAEGDIGTPPSLIAILVITAVSGVIVALVPDLVADIGERVAGHTADGVLEITTRVEAINFEDPAFHDLLQRASFAAQSRNRDIPGALIGLVGSLMATVSVLFAVVVIEPLLVPLVLLAGVPLMWANRHNSRRFRTFVHEMTEHDRHRNYFWNVLTNRIAVRETRAHRVGGRLHDRHRVLYDERIEAFHRLTMQKITRSLFGALLSAAIVTGTVLFLVSRLDDGDLATGEVGAAILAVLILTQRVRGVLLNGGRIYESALFIDDYLALREMPVSPPSAPAAPGNVDQIEGRGLTFTYPEGEGPALHEVDVIARRGEVIALVGENGSGKTTLAQILGGVYPATGGELLVDGESVATTALDPHRDRVSFVFQDFVKWALTGTENIALGTDTDNPDLDAVKEAARRAGAHEFLEAKSQGYDTILSRLFHGGADLSLGQWQRMATARAIHRSAPIVIFDEPTASLDPVAEREIFHLLREQMTDHIVIVISHRLSSVRSADRIYVLEQGHLVEVGRHDDLVDAGGAYQRLYDAQAAPFTDEDRS